MFELFEEINKSAEEKEKADLRKKEIERRRKKKKQEDIRDYKILAIFIALGLLSYLTLAIINCIFNFTWH